MLLAIDIGNSSAKFGLFDGESLVSRFEAATDAVRGDNALPPDTARAILKHNPGAIIVSSVVPEVNAVFAEFGRSAMRVETVFVDRSFDFGLRIKYETPSTLGIDRLVAASAAAAKYGTPVIVCDFGTATTIDAVNGAGEYLGGTITPGIYTLARSLFQNTSKLPEIKIRKTASVIGRSTVGSIESGVFYGYIGLVEGILGRMKSELAEKAKVVATGGAVDLILAETPLIDMVDAELVLEGLRRLYTSHKR